ncbi:hypothetical protein F5Y08DRAFT_69926 [Xylaria arbuscula]|nr:hypothetical protein F5Y08DRAFT_69926 [Xylaria arbuscula]
MKARWATYLSIIISVYDYTFFAVVVVVAPLPALAPLLSGSPHSGRRSSAVFRYSCYFSFFQNYCAKSGARSRGRMGGWVDRYWFLQSLFKNILLRNGPSLLENIKSRLFKKKICDSGLIRFPSML